MSSWPPDYYQEFERREKLLKCFSENPDEWEKAEVFYAGDPKQWINDFCVTYDPRNKDPKPKTMPFILFPRQEELVDCLMDCINRGEGLLVEKSRDMGASWICCAVSVHQWRFVEGTGFGWGSRKQELVDKLGSPDSIFEKMRIIIDHLPSFMIPKGFTLQQHATFMRLINPENGSSVTGEAGDNIGRGGRKTVYFKDESAHYERPEKIEAALGDNTDVQIDISSVNGGGNVFHRRRKAGVVWYPDKELPSNRTRVFIMDWSDHPLKDDDWYNRRRDKAEREGLLVQFAQEIDRDYSSSLEGIIIKAEWVKAAIDAHIKLKFKGGGAKRAGLDVADEGIDKNALAYVDGVILRYCEDWSKGDTGDTARKAVVKCSELGVMELFYDCIGVGAGVKSETNRLRDEGKLPKGLTVIPWNASASGKALVDPEKNLIKGDIHTPKNKDYFASLSAQAYYLLAQRFYKTYKAITVGRKYPEEELISISSDIPQLHELIEELSQATQGESGTGKMKVNKKPDGTKSPNLADAVKMAYCPIRKGVNYNKLVTM